MSVIDLAKQLLARKALFLDTETTGLSPTDEIVEIAIIDISGTVLLDTLVKPTIPIPGYATSIHGISDEDVSDAPSFAEVLPLARMITDNRTIVIYNAPYDIRMMMQTAKAVNMILDFNEHVQCCMQMYAEFSGDWDDAHGNYRWHKLEVAAQQCGIRILRNLHRARADADLARRILIFIAESDSNRSRRYLG